MVDLEDAWNDLHDAKPVARFAGRQAYDDGGSCEGDGIDLRAGARAGHRSREWMAAAETELGVIQEVARCLRVIREGGVPE